jgi:Kef-type K+ transport system membrane component KefB
MTPNLGFLPPLVVLLIVARLCGEAALRLGQPAVIGQLIAGVLLGPSFLGLVWPGPERAVFPPDPSVRAALHAFGEFGILLLLALTGMEVDVRLLKTIGRPAISVAITGIAIPFACGACFGVLAEHCGRRALNVYGTR